MNRFATAFIAAFALAAPALAQDPAPAPTPQAPNQPTLNVPTPNPPSTAPALPPPPAEPEPPRRRSSLGPEIGFYLPTSKRARDAFGATWVNYGFGFRPIELASRKGLLGFDLNFISTRGSGRRALLIPASVIYKQAIGGGSKPGEGITPYFGVSTGLLIADLRSDNYGVHSGYRGGFGGSALLGVTYQTKAYIEARYQLFSKIKGFDLSGLNLSTGLRF